MVRLSRAASGTPRPIIDKLYREIAAAIADPAIRGRFADLGAVPLALDAGGETARHVATEIAKWHEIITKAGIKLDL